MLNLSFWDSGAARVTSFSEKVSQAYGQVSLIRFMSRTQVDLLGVMVWWNIQLNAVSLVNLVMVGFPHWRTGSCCGKQQHLLPSAMSALCTGQGISFDVAVA